MAANRQDSKACLGGPGMLSGHREILEWRRRAEAMGHFSPDELEELQAHALDAAAKAVAQGIPTDTAVSRALDRLGGPENLAPEYRKERLPPRFRDRITWMTLGYLFVEGLTFAAEMAGGIASWAHQVFNVTWASIGTVYLGAAGAGFGGAIWLAHWSLRRTAHGRFFFQPRRRWTLLCSLSLGGLLLASAIFVDYAAWVGRVGAPDQASALRLAGHWLTILDAVLLPTAAFGILLLTLQITSKPKSGR